MKAALYHGIRSIEIADLPDYPCGDDAIVLQNIYSSICGTDVAVYNHGLGLGHRITIGGEFGHETICRVFKVGKNVKSVKVGDRAYPYPLLVTGDRKRAGTIGGFSEYIYCPCPEWEKSIYHVDDAISDRAAALIEPFTVGCRAARRSLPQRSEKAAVFGAGTIGIAAAIALKHFGCEQVVICDHSDFRLNICRDLGFDVFNSKADPQLCGLFHILGKSAGVRGDAIDCDIWIDAAGADSILTAYEQFGKYNSRMVLVAVGRNQREMDILGLTFGQKSVIGSGGYSPQDVMDVLEIMKSGKWDVEKLITHEYRLDDLAKAIEQASHVDHALNVMIRFDP
ncbi:MAG: zinc-binding dehydrogenase [Clostridia bacterium]|nr:zinc-binding dehydrogenase [Clostridia bacterium]